MTRQDFAICFITCVDGKHKNSDKMSHLKFKKR